MDFLDQIRQAVKDSGKTRYRISKETGINQATLSRFVAGKQGLSTKSLVALARFLNLTIAKVDAKTS
jgi:transcriptional regulator with XRE-family HTH domain